jgi:tRNA A-37 threonylcarbamoyl transferase component Bud32
MQWLTVAEFADALPRLAIERLRQPGALAAGELVKDNPVRTVARLPDPLDAAAPGLFVKRHKFPDLGRRLKHLVLLTQPQREWRACRALQAAGISTCDVLAVAVLRRSGVPREAFLVSREVPGAVSLSRMLEERQADEDLVRELVAELARLTAALADGGFCHLDYHSGNLLVRPQAPAGQRLCVVDLHAVRLRRPRRRALARMLGMLTASAGLRDARSGGPEEFLRQFLACWKGGPGLSEEALRRWSGMVAAARERLRRRRMISRTKRCLVESTVFTVERTAGFLVHRRRDFPLDAAQEAVGLHERALAGDSSAGEVLRSPRRTAVTITPCPAVPLLDGGKSAPPGQVGPGRVCVKSFRRPSLAARLKDALRLRSRARTGWVAAQGFSVRRIAAARPLALLEARRGLSGQPDYLVTEALESDGTLSDLAFQDRLPSGERRRELGCAVARLLGQLAQERVYHPDTKPSNILVKEVEGRFRLHLVDLERSRFGRPMTRSRWVKCLARLNAGLPARVSLLDRMRCLRECGKGRWSPRERLAIAREVHRLSLGRRPAWLGVPEAG